MAILAAGQLALEIRYRDYDSEGWLQYDLWFRWQGEPLVRPDLLKADSAYWAARAPGAFRVEEHQGERLLAVLGQVLETGAAGAWIPRDEPAVCLAFYPHQGFPLWPVRAYPGVPVEVPVEWQEPDDRVTVIAMVDVINLQGGEAYPEHGPALILTGTRADLAAFHAQLTDEFAAFQRERGLQLG